MCGIAGIFSDAGPTIYTRLSMCREHGLSSKNPYGPASGNFFIAVRRKATVVGQVQAGERIGFEDVFRHCVRRAVRHEMAMNLDDVVFRRTDLAVRGLLTPRLLDVAAAEMKVLLEWSDAVTEAERRSVTGKLRYLS